jgi:hypothetical protein
MSEWITDRLPNVENSDSHGQVWISDCDGYVYVEQFDQVKLGTPWQTIANKPAPYVKPPEPKRWKPRDMERFGTLWMPVKEPALYVKPQKVYQVLDGEYEDEYTVGIFSTWAKAYDCAIKANNWWPSTYIDVWTIDGGSHKPPQGRLGICIVRMIENELGKLVRWVNPEYSADVDPTDTITNTGDNNDQMES